MPCLYDDPYRGYSLLEERPARPGDRCDRCGQALAVSVYVFRHAVGAVIQLGPECRNRWDDARIPDTWWYICRKERDREQRAQRARQSRMNSQDRIDGIPRWAWDLADEQLRKDGLDPRQSGWAGLRRMYAEHALSQRKS